MPTCRECNNDVESLVAVKVDGKKTRMCADCADRAREAGEVARESESVIQGMMGFKGRR
jgi:ribosome-binding protein aMBF1 (putative translation factor)